MATTYRGVVRGNTVQLLDGAHIPDGTPVQIIVPQTEPELTPGGHKPGTMGALAEYLRTPSLVTAEDTDELMRIIKEARTPQTFRGVFDDEEKG